MEIVNSLKSQLEAINATFDVTPYYINCGECDAWAEKVFDVLAGFTGVNVEIWQTIWAKTDTDHTFIRIDGKFYDAECLTGVYDHMELPIFQKISNAGGRRQAIQLINHNDLNWKEALKWDYKLSGT